MQPQIDAIHQAVEAGVKIVLCTGRPLAGVKPFVEQLGFDTEEEFIIVNNGCSTHSTKDWSLIDWEELSISDIDYLSTFIENDDVQISLFDEKDYFVLAEKANARVNLDAGLVGMTPQPIDLKEAKSGQHRFFEAMFVGEKSILMPLKINTILYSAKAIPPFVHRTISWKFYQTVQARQLV